jgi:hypothetical protein
LVEFMLQEEGDRRVAGGDVAENEVSDQPHVYAASVRPQRLEVDVERDQQVPLVLGPLGQV